MKTRDISILIIVLIIADQALKLWIKTHMHLDESIILIPNWVQLKFVENNGAAFGMQLASSGGFDWGKLLLSLFRIVLIGLLGWYVYHIAGKKETPKGAIVALTLILAGAAGNLVDSAFYGLVFSESTVHSVATFGGHYAPFMFGKVVDMFYLPLFQWNSCPAFLRFLVDYDNYFFGAIFNLADAYISVAVVYIILFQRKFAAGI